MNDAEFIRHITALSEEWNLAEERLKTAENWNRKVLIPAINELRYAGRKIVDAFTAHRRGDSQAAAEHIADACQDILRARHDVIDAVHGAIGDYADKAREKIGAAVLHGNFSNYGEMFALIREIGEQVAQSRKERQRRDEIYRGIENKMPRLIQLHRELEASLSAIEGGEKARQDKSRRGIWRDIAIAILSVVVGGVIVGVFS
jgi:hypothetical protein